MSTAENAEKRYLVENSIPELMDEFLLALVTDRPKDPRTYGTKWFETKSIEGSATGSALAPRTTFGPSEEPPASPHQSTAWAVSVSLFLRSTHALLTQSLWE